MASGKLPVEGKSESGVEAQIGSWPHWVMNGFHLSRSTEPSVRQGHSQQLAAARGVPRPVEIDPQPPPVRTLRPWFADRTRSQPKVGTT